MKIINGKVFDYEKNIEADIYYDCFKKEITNEKGEIFKENESVIDCFNKLGYIFRIYDEKTILIVLNKNDIEILGLDDIKKTTKTAKKYNMECSDTYPYLLKLTMRKGELEELNAK